MNGKVCVMGWWLCHYCLYLLGMISQDLHVKNFGTNRLVKNNDMPTSYDTNKI